MLDRAPMRALIPQLPVFHEEAFQKWDCLACANCCRNHSPRFKDPDIRRIARHLKIREGALVSLYLRVDEEGDYVTQSSPCPFLGADNYCQIYEVRPGDCRQYPYTDQDVLLRRKALTLKNALVCPAVFEVLTAMEQALDSSTGGKQKPPKD